MKAIFNHVFLHLLEIPSLSIRYSMSSLMARQSFLGLLRFASQQNELALQELSNDNDNENEEIAKETLHKEEVDKMVSIELQEDEKAVVFAEMKQLSSFSGASVTLSTVAKIDIFLAL